jgi:putative transposase
VLNYKFRLYPTHEQELELEQTLDGCRWVYNYFTHIAPMSVSDMQFALTELKEQHSWLRNYHSKMLQMVVHDIGAARNALKELRKRGHKTGKLSYRSHNDFNAFTYNQSGFRVSNAGLTLAKVGTIKIVLHREPLNIKQVTVCRKNGKWYAVVACEVLRRQYCVINYKRPVGIDVGITKFCHDSDNNVIDNPQFLTKMLRPVKRAHRRLSRRQAGSNNHERAKHMLARLYERIHNRRMDFLHKTSAYYSEHYDLIFLERLGVANMTKNHRLARKILDASWSTFKQMFQYKANRVVEVEPAYTSISCSRCGHPVPKSLAVRTHVCPECGAVLDRDYNSSLNHLQNGLKLLGLPVERREVTPVEIAARSLKQEEACRRVQVVHSNVASLNTM